MKSEEIRLDSATRGATDLTEAVRRFCDGLGDGLLNLFAPHSTVGLALMQTADDSLTDVLEAIQRLIPRDLDYHHVEKVPGHGADHVLPVLVSPTLVIPVAAGRPLLGAYQHVVLLDLDEAPTPRRVRLTFIADTSPS